MTDAAERLDAAGYPHPVERGRLVAYARELADDDGRLLRLADAEEGLRALEDPIYHAVRWLADDPALGLARLVDEVEELGMPRAPARPPTAGSAPTESAALDGPRRPPRGRRRAAAPARTWVEIVWPDLTTARGTPYTLPGG